MGAYVFILTQWIIYTEFIEINVYVVYCGVRDNTIKVYFDCG